LEICKIAFGDLGSEQFKTRERPKLKNEVHSALKKRLQKRSLSQQRSSKSKSTTQHNNNNNNNNNKNSPFLINRQVTVMGPRTPSAIKKAAEKKKKKDAEAAGEAAKKKDKEVKEDAWSRALENDGAAQLSVEAQTAIGTT
jgi:hypothetical protein